MPELPEVQTIVSDLNKVLPGLKIIDVWTDWFEDFKKELVGRKILNLKRRAKFILINLSENKTLVIHQKLTGHLLYGKYQKSPPADRQEKWIAVKEGYLKEDPKNQFIHLVVCLSNKKHLVLSDLRKFAKVLVWNTDDLENLKDMKDLGPEPLAPNFTFEKFKQILIRKKGRIKQVLMDQKTISGIGNIYSDEILWETGIYPLKLASILTEEELKKIYKAILKVLNLAIKAKGDSMSDYRRPSGEKGGYQDIQNAYQMDGTKCKKRDGGIIKRIKIGGRSAHFCPVHQKI